MHFLINLIVFTITSQLLTVDDVIFSYTSFPIRFEDRVIDHPESVYIIEYDINNDNLPDTMITCPETNEGDYNNLVWYIYLQDKCGNYEFHSEGVSFSPKDIFLVKDENGIMHLGTLRSYGKDRYGIMPLELDKRGAMTNEGLRLVNPNIAEDQEWLQEGRIAAKGLLQKYDSEYITALKAEREKESQNEGADDSPEAESLSVAPDEVDM